MKINCNIVQGNKIIISLSVGFVITLFISFIILNIAWSDINLPIVIPEYEVGNAKTDISDLGLITDMKGSLTIDDISVRNNPDTITSLLLFA